MRRVGASDAGVAVLLPLIMASTTNNVEDEVRRRAYELWEQYGRPEGGEEEFWLKAEREIKQEKGFDRTPPEPSKPASDSDPQEKTPRGRPGGELLRKGRSADEALPSSTV